MSVADESVRDVLAVNLRRARTARNLSLSELARLSKIGKATLSALEAGAGNPTIETVFSLSRALEVPISDLLDQRRGNGLTVVRGAEVEVLRGEGVDLRPLRGITTGDTIFEVYDQQVRSHQESLGHVGTEHTIVQVGRLGVRVEDREVELGPGDYVGFDALLPHTYTPLAGPVRSVLLLHYRSGQRLHSAPACSGAGAEPGVTG
jgi:transcriptional regulator with XRE-family HTH domain